MTETAKIRDTIIKMIRNVAAEGDKALDASFGDDTVLLQSGLDSLDFAIVVARLDQELGDDPFTAMEEPVYPRTLSDFVAIYESHFADS